MKCLVIQIHPEKDPAFPVDEVIRVSRTLGRYPEVELADDKVKEIHLNYFSEELPKLWADLKEGLYGDTDFGGQLSAASIAFCEGDDGWNDGVLLHHFDASEKCSEL